MSNVVDKNVSDSGDDESPYGSTKVGDGTFDARTDI